MTTIGNVPSVSGSYCSNLAKRDCRGMIGTVVAVSMIGRKVINGRMRTIGKRQLRSKWKLRREEGNINSEGWH